MSASTELDASPATNGVEGASGWSPSSDDLEQYLQVRVIVVNVSGDQEVGEAVGVWKLKSKSTDRA